jgi:hypothetical protein
MTVLIAHVEADRAVAEALEKYLERRGVFAECETAATGFRALQSADVVVSLWSKETVFSPERLAYEDRALEGWADGRMILVKLDLSFPPVGLRDLPVVEACVDGQRDIAWAAIAKRALDGAKPAALQVQQACTAAAPFGSFTVAGGAALLAGGLATAAAGIVPTPAGLATDVLIASGIGAALVAVGASAFAAGRMRAREASAPHALSKEGGVVILCADADRTAVLPLIEGAARFAESADDVRGADKIVALLTPRAFESDAVKRGLFLARRRNTLIVPIISTRPDVLPADFAALLSETDAIDWSAAPESERARSLRRTLAA